MLQSSVEGDDRISGQPELCELWKTTIGEAVLGSCSDLFRQEGDGAEKYSLSCPLYLSHFRKFRLEEGKSW